MRAPMPITSAATRTKPSEANALLATDAHDPYFLEMKGQILLEGGKPAEAIRSFARQRSAPATRR